jgi:hypothetical protein
MNFSELVMKVTMRVGQKKVRDKARLLGKDNNLAD